MYNTYRTQEYRQQEVMGASPLRIVIMTYDVALQACERRDLVRATRAVSLLRDSLNFEQAEAAEAATGLFRLYQWCLDCIRQDNYPEAEKVLRGLREAWVTVEKRQMQAAELPLPMGLARTAVAIPAGF